VLIKRKKICYLLCFKQVRDIEQNLGEQLGDDVTGCGDSK
jgi:hypothetical protein